jgi:3-phosphoshikimate 1-carboxyvinyltransferase
VEAWRALGLQLDWDKNAATLRIEGCGGQLPKREGSFFIANSGTSIRFLTAALAACEGTFQLHGVQRMHQRPIRDLLEGLKQLGADVKSTNPDRPDCPPVQLHAKGLQGGIARVLGNVSSQFLSGLMMAAPYATADVLLEVEGDLVSKPYVDMTASVMRSFGVAIQDEGNQLYRITAPRVYRGIEYAIEPDASAASYFFAAAAILGKHVRVLGLSLQALQGDVAFVHVLEKMGAKVVTSSVDDPDPWIEVSGRASRGVDIDMGNISDTVQTLAAVALFAEGTTTVRGVEHNRHKETDRITDLARELRKLGASVDEFQDGLSIHPQPLRPAEIDTYNDHRMAMSLGLVCLKQNDVFIRNPRCTEKTYPHFFEDLARLVGSTPIYS